MANYIEFDPDKLFTGEIDPTVVVPIKYQEFPRNAAGTVVLDKNQDLEPYRNLFSLFVSKPSATTFNQVINTDFLEFTATIPIDTTLQDQLNTLLIENAQMSSSLNTDQQKIDALNAQIATLQSQIVSLGSSSSQITNSISDTLVANVPLFSHSNNSILSPNRKAKATIQTDGNFVVTVANYDKDGNLIDPTQVPEVTYHNPTKLSYPTSTNYYFKLYADNYNTEFIIATADAANQVLWTGTVPSISPAKAKLTIDDNGILYVYDGTRLNWTSHGAVGSSLGT